MAKKQNLSLNPERISGTCGRLMCCLRYEYPVYQEIAKMLPAAGTRVETRMGAGVVVEQIVPRESVIVELEESECRIEVPFQELLPPKPRLPERPARKDRGAQERGCGS